MGNLTRLGSNALVGVHIDWGWIGGWVVGVGWRAWVWAELAVRASRICQEGEDREGSIRIA